MDKSQIEKLFALTGCSNYGSNPGAERVTLPEQISALENALLRVNTELGTARTEIAELKAKNQDVETSAIQRAIDIAAKQGAGSPVAADPNKGAGKDGKASGQQLTGIEAVIASYKASGLYDDATVHLREKYAD